VTLVMASVVCKKSVISCVNHAVTNVIGCPNRILPIAHVSLVVTVSIFLISIRKYYPGSVGVADGYQFFFQFSLFSRKCYCQYGAY